MSTEVAYLPRAFAYPLVQAHIDRKPKPRAAQVTLTVGAHEISRVSQNFGAVGYFAVYQS
jgi:hypothetical protein